MKKRVLLLSLISTLSLIGCSNKKEENPSEQESNKVKDNVVEFYNFEQYAPDFELIRLGNYFGKVSVNTDTNFVKGGLQSAKLQPLGSYANDTKPFLYFELASERFNYDYTDLNYLYSFTFWIYNTSTETKEMDVGVATSNENIQNVPLSGGMTYYLKNGWNKITYFPDIEEIYLPKGGTKVSGIYFEFENVKSRDIEDAPVYYVDDITLKVKPEFREIVIEKINIVAPKEGDTIRIPNATIEGGNVTYSVIHGDLEVPTNNGSFVADDGGDYKIAYQSVVDGFVYKKSLSFFVKPADSVDIVNLSNQENISLLKPRGVIESIDWMSEHEGMSGVAKIVINRDWPSFYFTPQDSTANYDGLEYIALRMYIQSGDNTLRWISLNDTSDSIGYEGHLDVDKWVIYKFPIKSFLEHLNDSFFVGNSTSYVYFGTFYVAEIFAM